MKKEAILHIPLSQYAYSTDERSITVRIRTAKNDIDTCMLYYGNRVAEVEPIPVTELKMEICARDDLFDYFETEISSDYNRVCYYFKLTSGNETLYYYSRGFVEELDASRTEYFQFPYIRREEILKKPDWTNGAVMYHIFPDSFADKERGISDRKVIVGADIADAGTGAIAGAADSKAGVKAEAQAGISEGMHGGTLRGIIENIGYLKSLGVNLVYLNPIFRANSYHKYDTIDYFDIDPCFGTKADFKELVEKLHANGMKIILDGVFNHSGPDFFAFRDVLEKGERSKYGDWFYKLNFPIRYEYPPNYECFAYVKKMPKLNTGNREMRDYICSVGRYWISEFDIDGWRLDVANEVDHDTWRAFRHAVLEEKPDAFLIAEIWEDAVVWLKGDQIDSAMNYTFMNLCRDFFAQRKIGAAEFDEQMQKALMRYPAPVANVQMNFLDSHDVPRFLYHCNGDTDRLRLAFFYLLTAPGIPSIFYGDECFMTGNTEKEYRAPFPWDNTSEGFKTELSEWISLRKAHPALTGGGYRKVYADERGLYVFERKCAEETLFVIVNNSNDERCIEYADICAEGADTVYVTGSGNLTGCEPSDKGGNAAGKEKTAADIKPEGRLHIKAYGGAVLKLV
ncbi:MAG: glycoside hydrolase family 13 protein [Lachnospiraceae bacterium]|nr:glycoside hydrolase family 13 protein [Lachnospiraceae bacterium]